MGIQNKYRHSEGLIFPLGKMRKGSPNCPTSVGDAEASNQILMAENWEGRMATGR
jgi:hypothetical protein